MTGKVRHPYAPSGPVGALLFSLAVALLTVGCGVKLGVYHTVGKGETLWRIARTYEVDLQEVAEINNIQDARQIWKGQQIFIPYAVREREVTAYIPPRGESKTKAGVERSVARKIKVEKGTFQWPLRGKITTPFGVQKGRRHNGIDIAAPKGAKIGAAAGGETVYSGSGVKGYGNMVILKHANNFFTIYAHNSKNIAKVGEKIKQGEIIALAGDTGDATGNYLHFEVRSGKRRRNPLFFLP